MVPSPHHLMIHFQYQSLGQNCTFKVIVSRKTGTEVKMFEGICGDTFVIDNVPGSKNDKYEKNCPDWTGDAAPDCCVTYGSLFLSWLKKLFRICTVCINGNNQ